MRSLTFTLLLGLFFACSSFAQSNNWLIIPESGVISTSGMVHEMDFIRGDIPYPGSYYTSSVNSYNKQWFAGLKAEKRMLDNKLGLATGIKFTKADYSVGPDNYSGDTDDFFYWEVGHNNNNTLYYRVKGIEQHNSYLGIPVEARYFFSDPYGLGMYVKAGVQFDLLLNSNTDILFRDPEMEKHSGELTDMLPEPAKFISSIYAAGGITLGNPARPHADMAIIFPYGYLTETGCIVDRGLGFGCQLSLIIPLNNTQE
ncbi:MAG TPA: outer membrane beta-barrel protein [Lentimicrobium sp.]|nr:outer membrane beta-barrel protein [Lentimicrobium sp.]